MENMRYERSVAPRVINMPQQSVRPPQDVVSEASFRLGETLKDASGVAVKLAMEAQRAEIEKAARENKLLVSDMKARFQQRLQELMLGKPNAEGKLEGGLLNREGIGAIGVTQDFRGEFDSLAREFESEIRNQHMADMWKEEVSGLYLQWGAKATLHEAEQINRAEAAQAKVETESAQESLARALMSGDFHEIAGAEKELDAVLGKWYGGKLPPEVLAQQKKEAMGEGAALAVSMALEGGDLARTEALLRKYSGVLDPKVSARVQVAVQEQRKFMGMQEEARALADQIWKKHGLLWHDAVWRTLEKWGKYKGKDMEMMQNLVSERLSALTGDWHTAESLRRAAESERRARMKDALDQYRDQFTSQLLAAFENGQITLTEAKQLLETNPHLRGSDRRITWREILDVAGQPVLLGGSGGGSAGGAQGGKPLAGILLDALDGAYGKGPSMYAPLLGVGGTKLASAFDALSARKETRIVARDLMQTAHDLGVDNATTVRVLTALATAANAGGGVIPDQVLEAARRELGNAARLPMDTTSLAKPGRVLAGELGIKDPKGVTKQLERDVVRVRNMLLGGGVPSGQAAQVALKMAEVRVPVTRRGSGNKGVLSRLWDAVTGDSAVEISVASLAALGGVYAKKVGKEGKNDVYELWAVKGGRPYRRVVDLLPFPVDGDGRLPASYVDELERELAKYGIPIQRGAGK